MEWLTESRSLIKWLKASPTNVNFDQSDCTDADSMQILNEKGNILALWTALTRRNPTSTNSSFPNLTKEEPVAKTSHFRSLGKPGFKFNLPHERDTASASPTTAAKNSLNQCPKSNYMIQNSSWGKLKTHNEYQERKFTTFIDFPLPNPRPISNYVQQLCLTRTI